jgi:hypothetical protein
MGHPRERRPGAESLTGLGLGIKKDRAVTSSIEVQQIEVNELKI